MTAAAWAEPTLAIEAHGIVKRYGRRTVVDGVSLGVRWGEIVAVLGPNGAGKTTTLEVLEGYRTPEAGTIRVLGLDPTTQAPALRTRVGLMLQEGGIQPQVRPRELLRLYARFWASPRDPEELLRTVGLETVADTRWRRLSGGERQRLSLALALVGRPDLLILDEPTAGMDPEAKAATRALIETQRAAGTTILLTTHELTDVERLADRIVVIADGRVVASGTPAELVAGARPRLRLRLERPPSDDERAALAARVGRAVETVEGDRDGDPGTVLEVAGDAPDAALISAVAAWCAEVPILALEIRSAGATLEERYLELVRAAPRIVAPSEAPVQHEPAEPPDRDVS